MKVKKMHAQDFENIAYEFCYTTLTDFKQRNTKII